MMGGNLTQLGSVIGTLVFIWAILKQYVPYQVVDHLERYLHKFVGWVSPYIHITFLEYPGDGFKRSKAYAAIETYLATTSSTRAKRLKGDIVKNSRSLVLSMDDKEEIADEFQGVKIWWISNKNIPQSQTISFYPGEEERKYYKLTFHRRHRGIITTSYLTHVLDEGKAISVRNRQRKLYTNNRSENWQGYKKTMWSHVVFEHPARFETLAMDPKLKKEIINDLVSFRKGKDYYAKIGKAWKRGYLLYGPPGTGKSTMIVAMANFLEYDVYDVELTAVKDNTDLRKLLIDTTSKSIIVIEDIDCSLDLTGQREKQKKKDDDEDEKKDPISKKLKDGGDESKSKVTLSGLLNFIDGLWSACGGERIIVFTTNHLEKLDPALIRRGRMDKRIEMGYCCFEGFKLLANNYLDLESHHLFEKIGCLLGETNMTPADVAENLMPKSDEDDAESCLEKLIKALEMAKEEAKLKAEEEERLKAEKEEKSKEAEPVEVIKEEKVSNGEVTENGIIAQA